MKLLIILSFIAVDTLVSLDTDVNEHMDWVSTTERRKQVYETRSWFQQRQKLHSGHVARRSYPPAVSDGVVLFKEYDDDNQWQPFRISMVSGDVRVNRELLMDDGENGIIEDDRHILFRSLQRTTVATPTSLSETGSDVYRWKRRRASRVLATA